MQTRKEKMSWLIEETKKYQKVCENNLHIWNSQASTHTQKKSERLDGKNWKLEALRKQK